jgi:2-methylisocitrate lyase-like PEP mutase family enzyme
VGTDHDVDGLRERFARLHDTGLFVMPNAWDIGSARVLASLGFAAIATTSSGHAASLGRVDQLVTLDELVDHATAVAAAVDIPVSIDAERCYADRPEAIATTVRRLAGTGAAGLSIEDYDPSHGIDPLATAVGRVAAAAAAAHDHGMVLTARAENHLYGHDDLDDTIRRLLAYRDAGADVLYAPGLDRIDQIARVVEATGGAVNVLLLDPGPTVGELEAVGVRRVSTGGALAFAAYGALAAAARSLRADGTASYARTALSAADRRAALTSLPPSRGGREHAGS